MKPVGSAIVAEVCADFDLRRVAMKETEALDPLIHGGPAADGVTDLKGSQADGAQDNRGIFGDIVEPKRFSFFRGARR